MIRRTSHRPALALLLALGIGGCANRPPASHQDVAVLASCRQRADEVYQKQNRAELYRSDVFDTSNRDAPFATVGLPGITSRGLSGQYARDTLVDDCLNANAPGGATGVTGAGAAPVSSSPAALP